MFLPIFLISLALVASQPQTQGCDVNAVVEEVKSEEKPEEKVEEKVEEKQEEKPAEAPKDETPMPVSDDSNREIAETPQKTAPAAAKPETKSEKKEKTEEKPKESSEITAEEPQVIIEEKYPDNNDSQEDVQPVISPEPQKSEEKTNDVKMEESSLVIQEPVIIEDEIMPGIDKFFRHIIWTLQPNKYEKEDDVPVEMIKRVVFYFDVISAMLGIIIVLLIILWIRSRMRQKREENTVHEKK